MSGVAWRPATATALDGLKLFLRDWPAEGSAAQATPVLCLPGLTRNSVDFEVVADGLRARGDGRRVLAMDFRGRGQSDHAEDYSTYNPVQEATDAIAALTQLETGPVAILGTSRGGLVGMIIGLARPDLARGLALNDVGPVIEKSGTSRIMDFIGVPLPEDVDWARAAARVRAGLESEFPGVDDAHWEAHARRTFRDEGGRPVLNYDRKLRDATLEQMDAAPPDLWPQFDALKPSPLLVIRGENSDILSDDTVMEMARRRPDMESLLLADRGHAPFLNEPAALDAIAAWLAKVDAATAAEQASPPA